MPEVNAKVGGYEVDFYWREQGLVLELDGRAFHSDQTQRMIDRAKQAALEDIGLKLLRATFGDVDREPDLLLDRVAAQIRSRTGLDRRLLGK